MWTTVVPLYLKSTKGKFCTDSYSYKRGQISHLISEDQILSPRDKYSYIKYILQIVGSRVRSSNDNRHIKASSKFENNFYSEYSYIPWSLRASEYSYIPWSLRAFDARILRKFANQICAVIKSNIMYLIKVI